MCGIHAVISVDKTYKSIGQKFMEQGFIAGSLRGLDSSGMFQVGRTDNTLLYHKMALAGTNFLDNKVTKSIVADAAYAPITVGHVRHATSGRVTADNAHPFVAYTENGNRLVGVHNGTLTGWNGKKDAKFFDVDSEWAFNRIAEEGADAFEEFTGAFAMVWWDEREPGTLRMARNDQRPLHFGLTEDGKTMLLCSEAGMLSWLAERNSVKLSESTIYSLDELMLYEFDVTGDRITFDKSHLPKARTVTSTSTASNTNAAAERLMKDVNGLIKDAIENADKYEAESDDDTPVDAGNVVAESDPPKKLTKAQRKELRLRRQRELEEARVAADEAGTVMETPEGEYMVPNSWFTTSTATNAEQQVAKSMGIYGTLQTFRGIMYDPDVMEVYGEIEEYIVGQGKVTRPALIRGIKATLADQVYINGKQATWGAVVGMTNGGNYDGRYMVLSELTPEGHAKLLATA